MDEPQLPEEKFLAAGTVVLLSGGRDTGLLPAVVRRASSESMVVVPISADVHLATDWDLLLPAEPLGYDAMAQLWNYGSVLREQLKEVVGVLDDRPTEELDALAEASRGPGDVPSGLRVGPPVLGEDDPRVLRQEELSEWAAPFWEPALSITGSETVGQLVAHRREDMSLSPSDLEQAVPIDAGWLEPLEDDARDPRELLDPTDLAAIMKALRIGASRRLARITLGTLEGHAPQMARGGAGTEGPEVDPRDYVREMLSALAEDEE
jgi:hypothetical protein